MKTGQPRDLCVTASGAPETILRCLTRMSRCSGPRATAGQRHCSQGISNERPIPDGVTFNDVTFNEMPIDKLAIDTARDAALRPTVLHTRGRQRQKI